MTFKFHSINYTDAPDLTERSKNIGLWTSTLMCLVYAMVPAVIGIITGNMDLFSVCLVVSVVLMVALPIVMSIVRKILFKKLDEEYAARKARMKAQNRQPVSPVQSQPANAGRREVKIVFQRKAVEGGAACLTMILDYFGKTVPLDQVCAACNITENGYNAGDLMRVAKHYGLPCRGFKTEADGLRQYREPVIIHWCGNHFVVLERIQGNQAIILDPAVGKMTVGFEMIERNYTNVVLTFE